MHLATPRDGHALLSGKYKLGAVLGRGGMGLVREAEHLARRERVAVKLLRRDQAHIEEVRERFLREARTLRRIRDPHVVEILDLGETADGRPYFVMELLDGVCLGTLAKRRALSSVGEITELVRQACVGLAAVHRLGIVHRDVKPHNLVVTSDERGAAHVKLLDFGVASPGGGTSGGEDGEEREERGDDPLRLTRANVVMGTPVYMSPEQIRAPREADARSDVFSMGVVLYELLARRMPWRATSPVDLVVRQFTEVPPPVDAIRRDVPPSLARIVARCLELEPSQRFADGAELAAALAPYATRFAAAPLVVDDDDVHTVVREIYGSYPDDDADVPAPVARELDSLFSDHGAPAQPPPSLPPSGSASASSRPPSVAPAKARSTRTTSRPPRRTSRMALLALLLSMLLLPPVIVLLVRYVGPHVTHLSRSRALRSIHL